MSTLALTLPRLDPHVIYGVDTLGSLAMGVALLVTAGPLTELAGWPLPAGVLTIIGALLLPWAAYNLWIARTARPPRLAIALNIAGDIGWVAGTVGLAAIHGTSLSPLGLTLLLGQGIAVSGVLVLKLIGARSLA